MNEPITILVTGGAGFIGSNLVRHILTSSRHRVVNLDCLTYAGNLDSLSDIQGHPRYRFVKADLCDAGAVRDALTEADPDAIMHLAAESHVDRSIDGPGQFIQTNVLGTFHLLQATLGHYRRLDHARQHRFRFLHVSTDEVYGSLDVNDAAFTEDTAYQPHSPYSASKAASDHLARAWHDTYGLPVLVTNCSNNYGPYQFPEKLIPVVILKCLRGEPIPVYGTGQNVRDWLYVEDHCRALLTVLERGTPGSTYNIGGNNERTNLEVVHAICDLVDEMRPAAEGSRRDLIRFVSDRPGHDLRYAIDADRIRSELGWEPAFNFETGLRATVEWYLANGEWCETVMRDTYDGGRLGLNT